MMLYDLDNQYIPLEYFQIADFLLVANFMDFVMVPSQYLYQEGNYQLLILAVYYVWKKVLMQLMQLNIVLDHAI